MMELRPNVLSSFQYLNSWNNTPTSFQRISKTSPYDWTSQIRQGWNAFIEPTDGHTQPWVYQRDRQVALVGLYNVTQGIYRCANGGMLQRLTLLQTM